MISRDVECVARALANWSGNENWWGARIDEAGFILAALKRNSAYASGEVRNAASVDTHPEGGDAKQAPFMGSAVPHEDAGDAQPSPPRTLKQ